MLKTVEATAAGHPDKICDQIADAIVDEYVRRDPHARLDLNVLGSSGMLMIGGQVQSSADFDMGALAKQVYKDIGYKDEIEVFVNIDHLSKEMQRVSNGVRDTVALNGYATMETRERVPRGVVYAQNIARRLDELRRLDPAFHWLRPDGKVQVTMDRDRIASLTILASHQASVDEKTVKETVLNRIVLPVVGESGAQIFINPIGPFTITGFRANAGASGRRQANDTYGGLIPQGDAACSGKDPLYVERSGQYMARFVAKTLVEQGLATSALVHLVYVTGRAEPVHMEAVGMGTKTRGSKMDLTNLVKEQYDFRPEAIVERLDLHRPLYRSASIYGQFGREGFPWEEVAEPSQNTPR